MDVATSNSFINFGAFIAFIMVNVSVIVYWARERQSGRRLNPVLYPVCPAIGVLVIGFLLSQLDENAVILGSIWLIAGLAILAATTRGLRTQPPQMSLDEIEAEGDRSSAGSPAPRVP